MRDAQPNDTSIEKRTLSSVIFTTLILVLLGTGVWMIRLASVDLESSITLQQSEDSNEQRVGNMPLVYVVSD